MEDQTNPVTSSLQQAAMALRTAAVAPGADFARVTGFLHAVERLEKRWQAGDPAHTPRPAKGA